MLYKSPIFTQASGSVAGLTFSHNRGGMYTRARTIPTNPSTDRQVAIRTAMSTLGPMWSSSLTIAQRNIWNQYAANTPMTNRLGDTVYLTGQQHFLRSNIPRVQAGMGAEVAGPTTYDLGAFTLPTVNTITNAPLLTLEFTSSDDWVAEDGAAMLIYTGTDMNPGRSFFKGPWRYAGKIAGVSAVPPSSPQTATPDYTYTVNNIAWIKVRVTRADLRLSSDVIIGPTVIT